MFGKTEIDVRSENDSSTTKSTMLFLCDCKNIYFPFQKAKEIQIKKYLFVKSKIFLKERKI